MGVLLSDSPSTPSLILLLPSGSSTELGACMGGRAGSARLGLALAHSLPPPCCHHLNPDRVKPFQPFRKETLGTVLKFCWRKPIKSSHPSSCI